MARMIGLSAVDVDLLTGLNRFRLLTADQCVRLGMANPKHVRERLRRLLKAGLIHVTERGGLAGPHVYCLAPKGATTAAEWSEGRLALTPRKAPFGDTEHLNQRVAIVDVHMGLRAWAESVGAVVPWVRVEFDPNPSGLAPVTTVTHASLRYDADAVAHVTTADCENWLLAVEMETGGRTGSLSNFKARLDDRLTAFEQHVLEHALDWPKNSPTHRAARLLFVFKSPLMLEEAKKVARRKGGSVWRRVFFNSLPTVVDGFASGWWQVGETTGSPFRPVGAS